MSLRTFILDAAAAPPVAVLVAVLGVVLNPAPASALPVGGAWAGPTQASGGSAYWNPAALAAHNDTSAAMVEGTGIYLRANYVRDGIDPRTGEAFEKTSFTTGAPDLAFTLAGRTPWPWLRIFAGGFSAVANGVDWDEDSPLRHHATRAIVGAYATTLGILLQPSENYGLAIGAGPMYGILQLGNVIDFGAFGNSKLAPGSQPLPLEDPRLEAPSTINAAGWSTMTSIGAWARPLPWLRLGASALLPRALHLRGSIKIEDSEALRRALPGFQLAPSGRIRIDYPMPWQLHLASQVAYEQWSATVVYQFMSKGVRQIFPLEITESKPDFINGRRISVTDAENDWMLGGRIAHQINDAWQAAARVDVDPRFLPTETLTGTNLDFTTVQVGFGGRWQHSDDAYLELTYTYYHIVPVQVENSVYRPNAPSESGLSAPSANGRYTAVAHFFTLGWTGLWGG